MLYRNGVANSLLEIAKQFLDFAQESSESIPSWEIMSDRVDTFFGGTIRIPLSTSEESLKEDIVYVVYSDNLFWYVENNGSLNKVVFADEMKKKFPNSTIEVVHIDEFNEADYDGKRILYVAWSGGDFPDFCIDVSEKDLRYEFVQSVKTGTNYEKTTTAGVPVLTDHSVFDLNDIEGHNTQTDGIELYKKSDIVKIIRKVCEQTLNIFEASYYVSFTKFDNTSYQKFMNYRKHPMNGEFNYHEVFGRTYNGKYGKNLFMDSGEVLTVTPHMSYDCGLWSAEHSMSIDTRYTTGIMPFYEYWNGTPTRPITPPLLPTTGCPWFAVSSDNIAQCGGNIEYYFTRTARSATITIRLEDVNKVRKTLYQTISFGCSYYDVRSDILPQLYCVGGTSALSQDLWHYWAPPEHVDGAMFRYDMRNACLSNSGMLYPTNFHGTGLSNFRTLNSDGIWAKKFTLTQDYRKYRYFDACGTSKIYGVALFSPAKSNIDFLEQYRTDRHSEDRDIQHIADRHYTFNTLHIYSDNRISSHIENTYYTYDNEDGGIIVLDDGSHYISVPNSWYSRLYHYYWYLGRRYWGGVNEVGEVGGEVAHPRGCLTQSNIRDRVHKKQEEITGKVIHKIYEDHSLGVPKDNIKYEYPKEKLFSFDIYVEPEMELSTFPTTTEPEKQVCKIFVELGFYPVDTTILVDWGDGGELESYNNYTIYDNIRGEDLVSINRRTGYSRELTRIVHNYAERGNYTINVYAQCGTDYINKIKLHDYVLQPFEYVNKQLPNDVGGKLFGGLVRAYIDIKSKTLNAPANDFGYWHKYGVYEKDNVLGGNVDGKYLRKEFIKMNYVRAYIDNYKMPIQNIYNTLSPDSDGVYIDETYFNSPEVYDPELGKFKLFSFTVNPLYGDIFNVGDKHMYIDLWEDDIGLYSNTDELLFDKLNYIGNNLLHISNKHIKTIKYVGDGVAYIDLMGIPVELHTGIGTNKLIIDHIPKESKIYVYAVESFKVLSYDENVFDCTFYCKREIKEWFEKQNPLLKFEVM